LTTVRFVPGPGAYPQPSTLAPNGKYYVSKYKNSGAPTINPARSERFPTLSKCTLYFIKLIF